ncbi:MAG: hypothetical protein ACRD4B_00050 [Acidobacteriota bacterium]
MAYDSEGLNKEPGWRRKSHLDIDLLIAVGLGEVAADAPREDFVALWDQEGYEPRQVKEDELAVPGLVRAANDRILPLAPGAGVLPHHK